MSAKIIQVQRGKDSKLYPSPMPVPRGDRIKIILRLHELVHGLGYSQREAQKILLAEGWRRSTGSICYDLSRPMCAVCQAASSPEPEPSPPAAPPRAAGGAGWAGPAPW